MFEWPLTIVFPTHFSGGHKCFLSNLEVLPKKVLGFIISCLQIECYKQGQFLNALFFRCSPTSERLGNTAAHDDNHNLLSGELQKNRFCGHLNRFSFSVMIWNRLFCRLWQHISRRVKSHKNRDLLKRKEPEYWDQFNKAGTKLIKGKSLNDVTQIGRVFDPHSSLSH